MYKVLYVGMGGFFGSVMRYLMTLCASRLWGNELPYGTLIVNAAGGVLIGFIMELSLYYTPELFSPDLRLFLTTGVMGGFTTFSTFSYESICLLSEGKYRLGVTNIGLNLALGLGGVVLGRFFARRCVCLLAGA